MLARATMLEMFGQKAAALRAFEQALEFYPLSGDAWFGRADLVKFTRADPAIAAMEALLAPEAQPSFSDRLHLNFALGKAFLDIGDLPAAFRHLHEGNRLEARRHVLRRRGGEPPVGRDRRGVHARPAEPPRRPRRALVDADLRCRHAALGHDIDRADPRSAFRDPRGGRTAVHRTDCRRARRISCVGGEPRR